MVPFGSHGNGAQPFSYQNPNDPVMQLMGTMEGATDNGSEQQFLPSLGSAWRGSTVVGTYAPVHPNIPSLSPGQAAIVTYGRGFGDTTRGYVMYEGGHDNNKGTIAERVAAQRAFFNYSFYATTKTRDFGLAMSGAPPIGLINESYNLSFTVPSYIDPNQYTIKWTSSGTGTFSPDDHSLNVTYTPTGSPNRADQITVTLTDGCSREFASSTVTYMSGVLAKTQVQLMAVKTSNHSVELNWISSAANNVSFQIEKNENNNGFKSAGVVWSNGNPSSHYSFIDSYSNSHTLYRLRIIDQNGNVSYSSVVKINGSSDQSPSFTLLSNPVHQNVRLIYQTPSIQDLQIELVDMQGRIVMRKETRLMASASQLLIEIPANTNYGQYLLRLKTNTSQESIKVVIR